MVYSRTEIIKTAIISAINAGRFLQQEVPCIADEYRGGAHHRDIAEKYWDILQRLGITSKIVARRAIGFAIRGHDGKYSIDAFCGLITDRIELEELAKKHELEKKPEDYVTAGKKAVIANGGVPWIERQYLEDRCVLSEVEFAIMLTGIADYQHHDGRMNSELIAKRLNELYHDGKEVRDRRAVNNKIFRYKCAQEKAA